MKTEFIKFLKERKMYKEYVDAFKKEFELAKEGKTYESLNVYVTLDDFLIDYESYPELYTSLAFWWVPNYTPDIKPTPSELKMAHKWSALNSEWKCFVNEKIYGKDI